MGQTTEPWPEGRPMQSPYVEIRRITAGIRKGRYQVRTYDADGFQIMRVTSVYRWLWMARRWGVRDARKALAAHPVSFEILDSEEFIERILL